VSVTEIDAAEFRVRLVILRTAAVFAISWLVLHISVTGSYHRPASPDSAIDE